MKALLMVVLFLFSFLFSLETTKLNFSSKGRIFISLDKIADVGKDLEKGMFIQEFACSALSFIFSLEVTYSIYYFIIEWVF